MKYTTVLPTLATLLATGLTLSACAGAGTLGSGTSTEEQPPAESAPATTPAAEDGVGEDGSGEGTGSATDASADGTSYDSLLTLGEFPREGYEVTTEEPLPGQAPKAAPTPADDTLFSCTENAIDSRYTGGYSDGGRRNFIKYEGDVVTGVALLLVNTEGMDTGALDQWRVFDKAITGCADVSMRDLPVGTSLGDPDNPVERIDFTKDLEPEDNEGVGLTCFGALQLKPEDDGTESPQYSTMCVAADENRILTVHSLYGNLEADIPEDDILTWTRGAAWDAFVAQGEKIGMTVEAGA